MSRTLLLRALAALALAAPSFAHDGHGAAELSGTSLHYLLEPIHAPLALLAVGVVAVVVRGIRARAERRALALAHEADRSEAIDPEGHHWFFIQRVRG